MVGAYATLSITLGVNGLALWVAGRLANRPPSPGRLLLATAFSTLPTVWVLIRGNLYAVPVAVDWTWPLVVAWTAFSPMPRPFWPRTVVTLYATLCAAGGVILALEATVGRAIDGGVALSLAASALIAGGAWLPRLWRQARRTEAQLGGFELDLGGRRVRLTGLWDSGNRLRDPVLDRPVMIVELRAVWERLPTEVLAFASGVLNGGGATIPEGWSGRLGLVGYHSLGGGGHIPLIVPDHIWHVDAAGRRQKLMPMVVGLTQARVSPEGAYQALVPPEAGRPGYHEGVIGA